MNNAWFKTLERKGYDAVKIDMAIEKSHRDDVIALSVADSDYATAPMVINALNRRVAHGAFGYSGLPQDYKTTIQDWFKRRYRCDINADWALSVPKVMNALAVIMNVFTSKTDKVLIQTPVYHVFKPTIEINERIAVENKLIREANGYRIDFETLEAQLKTGVKLFILCSPHNPVGRVFTPEELRKMVSLCKQYNVLLVSDEIHADLIMPGYTFTSVADYVDAFDRFIVVSSPGKTFNLAGLHAAYLIVPNGDIRQRLAHEYQALHLGSPNVLAYTALKAAYQDGAAWVVAQNEHIHANYAVLKKAVERWHENAWIAPLEGTYLTWVDVAFTGMTSEKLTDALARYGVVVTDGHRFGEDYEHYMRIGLACSKEQLEMAICRIETCFSALGILST